jgi:hypothetical protein
MTTSTTEEIKVVFEQKGDFQAVAAAEDWCRERGISVGSMERGNPRGLLRGDFAIAKWRNLSVQERIDLDGAMTGDMRNGPVIIRIKGEAT